MNLIPVNTLPNIEPAKPLYLSVLAPGAGLPYWCTLARYVFMPDSAIPGVVEGRK